MFTKLTLKETLTIAHELSLVDRYLSKVNLPHLNQTIRNLKKY